MAKGKKIYEYTVVQDFLKNAGGEHAIELVKICLSKKKLVTDEEIGKKMPGLKVTEIRAVLNRLHYRGIACYQKTKNNKTGWYSYTWEIKPSRIAELIIEGQAEQIEKLEKDMDFQGTHEFYSAGGGQAEYPFEIAAEYGFKCPQSGKPLEIVDNKKKVKELTKKVENLKTEVQELQQIN